MSSRNHNYKYCVVPGCTNTTITSPDKVFITVPKGENVRKEWCQAMKRDKNRDKPFSSTSSIFCCEDHFVLEHDMENYLRWKMMGGAIKLKNGVVPHKFECQRQTTVRPKKSAGRRHQQSVVQEAANTPQPSAPTTASDIEWIDCGSPDIENTMGVTKCETLSGSNETRADDEKKQGKRMDSSASNEKQIDFVCKLSVMTTASSPTKPKKKVPAKRKQLAKLIPNSSTTTARESTPHPVKKQTNKNEQLIELHSRLTKKISTDEKKNEQDEKSALSPSCQITKAFPNSRRKKLKLCNEKNNINIPNSPANVHPSKVTAGDKYDALGKYVATEVRRLEKQQRMIVEKIICEAIHAGKIGSLNGNTKLILNYEPYVANPSHDDEILCQEEEVKFEKDVEMEDMDIDEPKYSLVKHSNEIGEASCSDGDAHCNVSNLNAEKVISSKETTALSRLHEDVDISIKVEDERQEDTNPLEESELPIRSFEEILIKQEIVREDDESLGDMKTEFVINKQQSSIEVYRSSDAKRKRTDCTEEAKIHLELLHNPKVNQRTDS